MKSERFKRTKAVMASVAIALVVAALAFGVSSSVLGPKSAIVRHLGFDLTSGTSSFTITSSIYPSPACSGSPALLYPATTRCMVFSVHNNLKATISVQSISTALDTTNFPAPPADCAGTNLSLPTFSGSFNVPGGGDATSPGVPIELKDNGAPQNDCENYTYNFVYSGNAIYTEVYGTTTGLASSQNPSNAGQSVTYTATVTASATASQDPVPSSPTGTVTFQGQRHNDLQCPVPVTSTGTTTATAQCTVNYATTAGSPHPITASYTEHRRKLHELQRVALPGGQLPDHCHHLEPHQHAQPVDLRLLGELHRHRLGLVGHARRHGDLLQLHHLGLHDQDRSRGLGDAQRRQGHLLDLQPGGGHQLRRGPLRRLGQLRR